MADDLANSFYPGAAPSPTPTPAATAAPTAAPELHPSDPEHPYRKVMHQVINSAMIPFQALSAITGIVDRPFQEYMTDPTQDQGKKIAHALHAVTEFGKEGEYSEKMRKLIAQKTGLPQTIALPQWQSQQYDPKQHNAAENFAHGTVQNLHNWTENVANTGYHTVEDVLDSPSTLLGGSGLWRAAAEHGIAPGLKAAGTALEKLVPGPIGEVGKVVKDKVAPALRPSGVLGSGFQGAGLRIAQGATAATENAVTKMKMTLGKAAPESFIGPTPLGFDESTLERLIKEHPQHAEYLGALASYPNLVKDAHDEFLTAKNAIPERKMENGAPLRGFNTKEESAQVWHKILVKKVEDAQRLNDEEKYKKIFGFKYDAEGNLLEYKKDWIRSPIIAKAILEEGRGLKAGTLLSENEKAIAANAAIKEAADKLAAGEELSKAAKEMASKPMQAIFDKETMNDLSVIHAIQQFGGRMGATPFGQGLKFISDWRTEMMFLLPWAHMYGNVGWNTWKAGGVKPMAMGLRYASDPSLVPKEVADIMQKTGLEQTYMRDETSAVNKAMANKGGLAGLFHKQQEWSNNQIQQMEYGMRAALMETMMKQKSYLNFEKEYGKDIAPYLLAHDVDTYVGSYMNQPAIIALFKGLGAQFPQYHFVVTPQVVMKNLATHPERINMTTALWNNINADMNQTKGGIAHYNKKGELSYYGGEGSTHIPMGTNTGFGRMIGGATSAPFPKNIGEEAKSLANYALTSPSGFFGPVGADVFMTYANLRNPSLNKDPINQILGPSIMASKQFLPEEAVGPAEILSDTANSALIKARPHEPKPLQQGTDVLQSLLRAFGTDPYAPWPEPRDKEEAPQDTFLKSIRDAILESSGIYERERVHSQP